MADIYDMLLTGDLQDQGRMAAMARRLRQREALGTLGALSGDPVLGPWGTGEIGRARESATGLVEARQQAAEAARQAKLDARQARMDARPRPSGNPAFFFDAEGNPTAFPGYAEAQRLAHERRLELERQKEANRAAAAERKRLRDIQDRKEFEEWKRTQPTPTQAGAARKTQSYLPRLAELVSELKQVEIPTRWEVGAGLAREHLPAGEAFAAMLERTGMEPGAVDWLAKGRQMEQDITRLASGLAVTGFEFENLKKWSPWAMGLTNREREQRVQNIYNSLGGEASAILNIPWENISFAVETQATDQPGAMPQAGLAVGFIHTDETGARRRFKGGDPNNQNSWEAVP